MTNLMKSLGYQVIKILPKWCFKKEPLSWEELEQLQIPLPDTNPCTNGWIAKHSKDLSREELEQLAISQNDMLNDRDDELFEMQNKDKTIINQHWYWITMYLIGIGTGIFGTIILQSIQALP